MFDANVSHLGRLPAAQVGPVLEAYIVLKEYNRSLVLFSTPDNSGQYRAVGGQDAPQVGLMLQSLLPRLEVAIASLDGGYGQFWGMRSGSGLVLGSGDRLAVAEADAANDLGEAVGAVQSAPVALG